MAQENFVMDGAYLESMRTALAGALSYAKYKIGETWHTKTLASSAVLDDGTIVAQFTIDDDGTDGLTVSEVELYTGSDARVGGAVVNIARTDASTGVLYAVELTLFQAVENAAGTGEYDALDE